MTWSRCWPVAWSLLLASVLLGPALGPGYVLSYDMVWVPDLSVRPDLLGLGSALPRAVPSDLVVALVDELTGGVLLQKLVLVGSLAGAGVGADRLVRYLLRGTDSTVWAMVAGRMTASSVAIWNPFMVERLWIGHWTVLIGAAVAPWLVVAAVEARRSQCPWALPWLLLLGSLSASAGLVTATLVLGLGWARRTWWLLPAVIAANAPWLVTGMMHADEARAATGTAVFGLRGDSVPAPLAALGLAGIWNTDVVPGSRSQALLPLLSLLALACAVGIAAGPLARACGRRTTLGLVGCYLLGLSIALLTWIAPGLVDALAESVPGVGLVRDGSRSLGLCLPLVVLLAGAAAWRVAQWAGRRGHPAAACAAALVPVALLPDAAYGISGHLGAVSYPASWSAARAVVAKEQEPGDVLVLPFGAYRSWPWNRGRIVLDPMGRFLTRPTVTDDRLRVDGVVVSGEDPRVEKVSAALNGDLSASVRSRRLAEAGIGTVVVTETSDDDLPALAAETLMPSGASVQVLRLDAEVSRRAVPAGRLFMTGAGWALYGLLWLVPIVWRIRRYRQQRSASDPLLGWYRSRRTQGRGS